MKGTNIMSKNIHATQEWAKNNFSSIQGGGKNLFDKSKAELGYYININGTTDLSSNYFTSAYIPIEANKTYVAKYMRYWHLYDKEYNKIYSEQDTTATKIVTITTDSNAAYFRFSAQVARLDTMQLELGEEPTNYEPYSNIVFSDLALLNENQIKQISNVLYGKKWCVVGDSFSSEFENNPSRDWKFIGGKFDGKSKTYSNLIADRNNMIIQDMAVSGKTLATPADGSSLNTFSLNNYQNIDSDVDYITIMLGINDGHKESATEGTIPFGDANDTDNTTFCGAWNVVLPYLMEFYPNARIGIIVSNGLDDIKYRNATIAAAKKYGIPYIDLNGDERTQAMHRAQNTDLSSEAKTILMNKYSINISENNTHPNKLAHEIESTIIENFLRSL